MSIEKYTSSIIRPHSRKIITQAEIIKEKVENNLFIDEAPKRKLIEWITIDWAWSRDLDDWVWAEKTSFWYTLFVSISDTSEFIKPNSIIDNYAFKRPSSIYLSTHNYHMIPKILSTDILSLNNHKETLTQTLEVNFDKNYNIINTNNFESVFYNKNRYDYEEFDSDFYNPESQYFETLHILYNISQALKQKRIKAGANPLFRECISIKIDKKCIEKKDNIWQEIISEIAILKNSIDAIEAYKNKTPILFRWFKPQLKNKITWNINSNRWFFNFKPTYHLWFKNLFYTYNTSPIRRYSDIINQRQIKSTIRWEKELYNITQIRNIALKINTNIEKIIYSQKQYNKEVFEKRSERLLKKLKEDNFENIWSLWENTFFHLIRYFMYYNNSYFSNDKIINEILYRLENNLLDKKTIWLLKNSPNNIEGINIFKEIIKIKQKSKK